MPVWTLWLLFAVAALAVLVGAKALDDRDRRRFGSRGPAAPRPSSTAAPSSDPPSGSFQVERAPLGTDLTGSGEIAIPR